MAHVLIYNPDFTDEDATRLCQLAPFANHPQHHYYTCGWMSSKGVCSLLVQGPDFPEHLRTHHGVVGPEKAELPCCWINCSSKMKKESLVRHVNEKHLEIRYQCPSCPEQFTRQHTLQTHASRKHG